MERLPWPLPLRIIELRCFARAKDAVDHAQKMDDLPQNKWTDLVMTAETEAIKRSGRLEKKHPKYAQKQRGKKPKEMATE